MIGAPDKTTCCELEDVLMLCLEKVQSDGFGGRGMQL